MGRVGGGGSSSRSVHNSSSRRSHSSSVRSTHTSSSIRSSRPSSYSTHPVHYEPPEYHSHHHCHHQEPPRRETVIVNKYGSSSTGGYTRPSYGSPVTYTETRPLSEEEQLSREINKNQRKKSKAIDKIIIMAITMILSNIVIIGFVNRGVRERVELKGVEDVGYVMDLGFFANASKTQQALYNLYEKSGIPVYIVAESASGIINENDCAAVTESMYHKLIGDECHIMVYYFDDVTPNGYWEWHYGDKVKKVFPESILNKLIDNIETYWETNMTNDEVFSAGIRDFTAEVYEEKADTLSLLLFNLVMVGIIVFYVVSILLASVRIKKYRNRLADIRTDEYLSKPLETFGSSELDELKDRYS